jgi:hypothetical protein
MLVEQQGITLVSFAANNNISFRGVAAIFSTLSLLQSHSEYNSICYLKGLLTIYILCLQVRTKMRIIQKRRRQKFRIEKHPQATSMDYFEPGGTWK